jgi:hypothetical protein
LSYFESADDVYATLGRLITEIASDPDLGPRLCRADTVVRYEHSSPEATITVRLQEAAPVTVEFGPSEIEPEVILRMSADVAHRFWLGETSLAVGLARGQIEALELLRLLPLANPAFPIYRRQLVAQGRADLVAM